MPKKRQERMFQEMDQKDIFNQAQKYAFDYADIIPERNVYPSPEAIADLDQFIEDIPESTGNAMDVLELLNQYGTPASVAQTVIRISICSWATSEDDITRSVGAFVAARNKALQDV
jgi:hypothetical protein